MSKDTINVKSNGLRNELKEIRKSIDKLTNAIIMAQTHKHDEKSKTIYHPMDSGDATDGMFWTTTITHNYLQGDDEGSVQGQSTRSKTSTVSVE